MQTRWIDVAQGSRVLGRDGYEWEVADIATDGTLTLTRDGRDPFSFKPAVGVVVDVTYSPPEPRDATAKAIQTLRTVMAVDVIECAWCQGDDTQDCVCEQHCGTMNCVNFSRPLEG